MQKIGIKLLVLGALCAAYAYADITPLVKTAVPKCPAGYIVCWTGSRYVCCKHGVGKL